MTDAKKPTGGRLYGVSLSPFVRKVRAVLAIKEIDYELVAVMPGAMSPEFLAKVPRDPYSGEPLLLKIEEDKAAVYSTGPDGSDNGGRFGSYTDILSRSGFDFDLDIGDR